MKLGALVQRWHDTGAFGTVPVYGVVTQETPKTLLVTWEGGRTSRVRRAKPNGVAAVPSCNLDVAREVLASKGVKVK